ncbi:hypothetical protein KZZ52_13720 [Dactylosporangium sp. AC04546]|uniref:hypothetical protein n=1 Tax=Dactylosporangium sp. AC04546 TaxID=2862460 RepID=UPI001EDF7665|nr:hypothetical protein [Dactylosporangium sp. AC04546]WVK86386.1 hypothetical protein KZZ52_13720 [Dactylosporangium sp. AC04546]
METRHSASGGRDTVDGPAGTGFVTNFIVGLFGYLVALVAFGYVGLFAGGADAGDQLAGGLGVAYLVAIVTSVVVPVVAVVRSRRRQRRGLAALLSGMALGLLLMVLLTIRVVDLMNDVASTCPCEPIVDQLRISRQYTSALP